MANFSISLSVAPRDARPISCENCANKGSANNGTWPNSSWTTSLKSITSQLYIGNGFNQDVL